MTKMLVCIVKINYFRVTLLFSENFFSENVRFGEMSGMIRSNGSVDSPARPKSNVTQVN